MKRFIWDKIFNKGKLWGSRELTLFFPGLSLKPCQRCVWGRTCIYHGTVERVNNGSGLVMSGSLWEWDCFMNVAAKTLEFGREEPEEKKQQRFPSGFMRWRGFDKSRNGRVGSLSARGEFRRKQAIVKLPNELGDEPFQLRSHDSCFLRGDNIEIYIATSIFIIAISGKLTYGTHFDWSSRAPL